MEEGLKLLYSDQNMLKMMVVHEENSNITVNIEHEIFKINLDTVEPPLALPTIQEIDEATGEQQE